MTDDEFDTFVSDALALVHSTAAELQEHFGLGQFDRWDMDQETGLVRFSAGSGPTIAFECIAIGSTSNNTWKWAWANQSIVAKFSAESGRLKLLSEKTGMPVFEQELVSVDDQMPWEFCGMALHELGGLGAYRCGTDDKALFVVLKRIRNAA